MEIKIASQNYIYYVNYVDNKDKAHERQFRGLFAVKELIDVIENRDGCCMNVVRAGVFDDPVIIYSDGEWFPVKT